MCGITGFYNSQNKIDSTELNNIVKKMSNCLNHRGPDDEGVWIDSNNGIGIAHKRLSIIDLSELGHQPMISNNGRYVISYNGEIYNFKDLEIELRQIGYDFKTKSDTEVILLSFEEWGVINSLKKFDGMFAFAVWDRKNNEMWLSRDKIGEKPLYYGFQDENFFFGSELKSIIANPYFKPKINTEALNLFLKYSYVPSPLSIFDGIKKLLPGHFVKIDRHIKDLKSETYWNLFDITKEGKKELFYGNEKEASDRLEQLLLKNIESRMISDVPIGAFLSGGIDSSLIVSMMQKINKKPVNTFTIGFENNNYNEAPKAKRIAQYLGTNHTELYVSDKDAIEIVPDLSFIYDEPFADSSQIPTNLVSELAKKHVSVSLSGDGGDELFGGYNRYFLTKKYMQKLNLIPFELRNIISRTIESTPISFIDKIEKLFSVFSKEKIKSQISSKFYKIGAILKHNEIEKIYEELTTIIRDPEKFLNYKSEFKEKKFNWNYFEDKTITMQYLDLIRYHPDDILVKVDRASMNYSLENRVPFLSPEIIEFSIKLPRGFLFKDNKGKWILRQVLNKYVPKKIIDGPKIGFGVPINEWLRKPLNDWGNELISDNNLKYHGLFNIKEVKNIWDLHQKGKFNFGMQLWNILIFQSWYERWMKKN